MAYSSDTHLAWSLYCVTNTTICAQSHVLLIDDCSLTVALCKKLNGKKISQLLSNKSAAEFTISLESQDGKAVDFLLKLYQVLFETNIVKMVSSQ